MRANPVAWKEYRRQRHGWIRRTLGSLKALLPYFLYAYVLTILVAAARQDGGRLGWSMVALYASATTIFRGLTFKREVLEGWERTVLLYMPVSDETFLDFQVGRGIRSWADAALRFLLLYGAISATAGLTWRHLTLDAAAALLQATCALAAVMWAIARAPGLLRGSAAGTLYVSAVASLWLPPAARAYLWSALVVTPGGWISHGLAAASGSGDPLERLWLVPAFGLAMSAPLAYRAFRMHLLDELTEQQSRERVATGAVTPADADEEVGAAAVARQTQPSMHNYLEATDWHERQWIERAVARSLRGRDTIVAEFMTGGTATSWTARWRLAAWITAGGVAIAAIPAAVPDWMILAPPVAAAACAAPLLGGVWPGFGQAFASGQVSPLYASFPLSYREISIVVLKANVIRILAWCPLLLASTIVLALRFGRTPLFGVERAVEVLLFVVALQPATIAARFSAGTNDTQQHVSVRALGLVAAVLALLAVTVVCAGFLFGAPVLAGQAAGAAGIGAASSLAWWIYETLFERSSIDLLSARE